MEPEKKVLSRQKLNNGTTNHLILFMAFAISLLIRISIINQYGLSEDEVLKALATQDYRDFDFSTNAQHPALMKIFITLSVLLFGETEFALRLPNVIIASLTVYPIFYLGRELYDNVIAYSSIFIWAVSIPAISFSTTVKEDAFLTFFWVLTIYYFVKAKHDSKKLRFAGMFLGLTIASKYMGVIIILVLMSIHKIVSRNTEYIELKEMSKFIIPTSLVTFSISNFPIFLPATISKLYDHYFLQKKIAPPRSGFIMMDELFPDRPAYYLLLFFLVKISIPILLFALLGILDFTKNPKGSNHIVSVWILIPLITFSFLSGYIRYLLIILPAFFYLVSIGILNFAGFLVLTLSKLRISGRVVDKNIFAAFIILILSLSMIVLGFAISPYYRMYVNPVGGGSDSAGFYFPQDSVYDFKYREAIEYINKKADVNATVATHIPVVGQYYGRSDLTFLHVLDLPSNVDLWVNSSVSYIIVQQSRIYEENQIQIQNLKLNFEPEMILTVLDNVVIEIYNIQP